MQFSFSEEKRLQLGTRLTKKGSQRFPSFHSFSVVPVEGSLNTLAVELTQLCVMGIKI
jgi:hypothetical protein